jgi:hypothetical protein
MSGPWAHVRLFSATLLVEQGWSHVHQPYHHRVNPLTRREDENVSRVLCARVLAGLGGAALVSRVLQALVRTARIQTLLGNSRSPANTSQIGLVLVVPCVLEERATAS